MSDNTNTEPQAENTAGEQEATEGEAQEPKTYSEDYVKKLRNESASYRTRLKEVEAQASEAEKLKDQLNGIQQERDTLSGELAGYKERDQIHAWAKEITKESHIPADALRGSTEEELKAHHDQLAALVPVADQKARHVVAGEGESTPLALNGDGIESALKNALGIK